MPNLLLLYSRQIKTKTMGEHMEKCQSDWESISWDFRWNFSSQAAFKTWIKFLTHPVTNENVTRSSDRAEWHTVLGAGLPGETDGKEHFMLDVTFSMQLIKK